MRIPLDYYRILGLPIQATAEQLKQAHRDRTQQLPRREYSDVAIDARKQLLDEAYSILSDPDRRQAYDMGFLAKTYDPDSELPAPAGDSNAKAGISQPEADSHSPSIEIDDRQFVGALLILQELGEYEQVVTLTRPFLGTGNIGLKDGRFGDPDLILPDVILTVALAYLELGREQWQQGQYENAATSLEAGQDILLRESLFASLRGEMQADLYKLRPYRILELLQLPETKAEERRRGLQLLREMLHERGGIDGHGDDRSGLSVEDFLRFIQQLRSSLTTTEQQTLFETEARRPSAVATYLAVYALLAQGFARAQPALIRKAKLMLMQLGRRQDVHLEKAVCSLLLGQTEEASRALELSQEREPIAFIRQNSLDSPDLLPGLCLYAERWLQDEVFPHFRDLQNQPVSLKDYFANKHVQSYLEALPSEVGTSNEWVVVQPRRGGATQTGTPAPSTRQPANSGTSATASTYAQTGQSPGGATATLTATSPGTAGESGRSATSTPPVKVPPVQSNASSTTLQKPGISPDSNRPPLSPPPSEPNPGTATASGPLPAPTIPPANANASGGGRNNNSRRTSQTNDSIKVKRLILVGLVGLFGIWLLWTILSFLFGWIGNALDGLTGPRLRGEQPLVELEQPPVPIPEVEPENPLAGELDEGLAQQVLRKWFDAKAGALGPEYQTEMLREILVDPALSRWVTTSETLQQENAYRRYQHDLRIQAIEVDEDNPNQGVVDAQVREVTQFYEAGEVINSGDDTLQVQYQLVRDQGPWRIRDWQVIR
ncbi:MAG: IMS domain-containing protein [Limnospira sp.]